MICHLVKSLKRSVPCGLLLGLAAVSPLAAQDKARLAFRFEPPSIQIEPICTVRPPDDETTRLWDAWDGGALPDMGSDLIKRDISRLMHLDSARWYDKAMQMITRLEERNPSFGGQNALITRISAMESAGRFETLVKAQLVPELAAYGDALSPRARTALAGYYRDGIGVPRDEARANELLMEAGYAGNADALLTLSGMVLDGTAPQAWDVPLELAVSMAFGSLVGELNPTICDRTARIAREYHSGQIVKQDPQLAHDWFRFTADLGDAYSAWKVVEYHLEAEGFERDNAVMLKYLTMASDAGLSYAQIELGRLYEFGALVDLDLNKALSLYEQAASNGERPGLTRVALFLERYAQEFPDQQPRRIAALDALTKVPDAPGWAFARMAEHVLEVEGQWAGAEHARTLLARAVELDDMDGTVSMANLILAEADGPSDFDQAVNLLARAVSVHGGISPLKTLFAAYTCRADDAPRLPEAQHWLSLEEATATANIDLPAREIIELSPDNNPLMMAALQSHALYGRPSALASWLKLLEYAGFADAEMQEFWTTYSDRYSLVLNALAQLEFELAENREQRLAAFGLLREEYKRSGPAAALSLAEALLESRTETDPVAAAKAQGEAVTLLTEIAELGYGKAIQLIAGFAKTDDERRAVFETYSDIIAADGDFSALLFAIPYVTGQEREVMMHRARGIMPCDYKNVMLMVGVTRQIGDRDATAHWLDVAETLMRDNTWAITDLAKARYDLEGPDGAMAAAEMFERSYAMGDDTAGRELFELRVSPELATFSPDKAVDLIADAVVSERVNLLAGYLGRFRKTDETTQTAIAASLDVPELYRVAASSGDVYSMRSYGQYLMANAAGPADLTSATDWLRQAAEWGDATAMADYGEALAFGIGVPANPVEAISWLERASDGGSAKAAEITRLIRLSRGG
ncbi:tetratricopeptide repeat protein [Loktanella sp. R86503]|uniref:tetratricopeptide repeat protein n=1 Tax=Loktanella sp. R86503 TaxID=3093847 RepID=UPI0036D76046